jgi:hypothetical protein
MRALQFARRKNFVFGPTRADLTPENMKLSASDDIARSANRRSEILMTEARYLAISIEYHTVDSVLQRTRNIHRPVAVASIPVMIGIPWPLLWYLILLPGGAAPKASGASSMCFWPMVCV